MSKFTELNTYFRRRGVSVLREPVSLNPDISRISNFIPQDQDGITFSPISHAVVAFQEDNRYYALLNRERRKKFYNLLGGGKIGNELKEETAQREIFEESGLEADNLQYLGALIFGSLTHGPSACPLYIVDVTNIKPTEKLAKLDSVSIAIVNLGWLIAQLQSVIRNPTHERIEQALTSLRVQ